VSSPATATIWTKALDRERWARLANCLAVAMVVSLPCSTSATSILVGLWLIALLPTLDPGDLRRTLATSAGGLPVLLWALGLVGMLWADVPLDERLDGLSSFHKLLIIPLLLVQFQRSEREAAWVLVGFLISCSILMIVSWIMVLTPGLAWSGTRAMWGVPVKDYISQSALFTVCIFALAEFARRLWQEGRRRTALLLVLLAFAFLANVFVVAISRTAIVVVPTVLLLFGYRSFGWKGAIGMAVAAAVITASAWPLASPLRHRVTTLFDEIRAYQPEGDRTPAGERLEFWRKSIGFVSEAPLMGHGTGSIRTLFQRGSIGHTGLAALVAANPHNQTLAVALQLGLVGTAVLIAMWVAHLLLFRGGEFAAWVGLVVVVQNIAGSLFNSHVFDFTHGWGYVLGVGIAGGVVLRHVARPAALR
jgi:O-antigen ligase